MDTVLFKESQHIGGGWLLIGIMALLVLVMRRRFKTLAGVQKIGAVITLGMLSVTAAILFTLVLETTYYPNRVAHRFASFFGTDYDVVSMDSVTSARVLFYDPSDYGGWGQKGNENTSAYNASGNEGILFTFRSGRQLLLGTQQPDTLYARVKDYYPVSK